MTKRSSPVALAMALLIGCNSGPRLVSVSGTVTVDGRPVEGATLVFVPDPSNKQGLAGSGVTDAKGNYTGMTEGRPGLVPGGYRVMIAKAPSDPAKIPPEFEDDPFMAQTFNPPSKKNRKGPNSDNQVEGEYAKEVPADGGILDFVITPKPQGKASQAKRAK